MTGAAARWLDRAPAPWAALVAADPSASPSHRPEVGRAFAATLPGYEWRLAVVEERGAIIGGVPVMVARQGGQRWLYALPLQLPAPPLALPGRHAEVDAVLARAVAELGREERIVGGSWSWYRPAGPAPAEEALAAVPGETRWYETGIVDLAEGLEGALARMGRKERSTLRRPRARTLSLSTDPARIEAAYALHASQSGRWGGHRPLPLELSRRLLAAEGAEPVARLFSLSDRRGLVSAGLVLDGPHESFVWWSGTHPDGRALGAFGLLLWRVVEWAAERGRARVNMGASSGLPGVASFKRALGVQAVRYPVRWLDDRHASLAGRAIARLQARVRRNRQRGEAG